MGTEKTHEYAPTLGYSNREGEEGVTSECLFGVCPARKKQCHILAGELVKESHSAANSMPLSSGGGRTAFGIATPKTPKQWHGLLTLKVQVGIRLTLDALV